MAPNWFAHVVRNSHRALLLNDTLAMVVKAAAAAATLHSLCIWCIENEFFPILFFIADWRNFVWLHTNAHVHINDVVRHCIYYHAYECVRQCLWVCVSRCMRAVVFSNRLQFVAHTNFIICHEMESCLTQHIMWMHTRRPNSLHLYSRHWRNKRKMTNKIDWPTEIHRKRVRVLHIRRRRRRWQQYFNIDLAWNWRYNQLNVWFGHCHIAICLSHCDSQQLDSQWTLAFMLAIEGKQDVKVFSRMEFIYASICLRVSTEHESILTNGLATGMREKYHLHYLLSI